MIITEAEADSGASASVLRLFSVSAGDLKGLSDSGLYCSHYCRSITKENVDADRKHLFSGHSRSFVVLLPSGSCPNTSYIRLSNILPEPRRVFFYFKKGRMTPRPEDIAREQIDRMLVSAGWAVQDAKAVNLYAKRGVAIREFELKSGYGTADYLLYIDGQAAGVIEAKKAGATLTGVEIQSAKYSKGLPDALPAWTRPLPFCYQSTGIETRFTNGFDPEPCSRQVFFFHKPETFADWLSDSAPIRHSRPDRESRDVAVEPLDPRFRRDDERAELAAEGQSLFGKQPTLNSRIRQMPPLIEDGLWPAQIIAIKNLEKSLSENRPRALIQMATGSGKTFTAINFLYRLIKFGGAKRVLFLVDRGNLGRQALKEFQQYTSPYNNFKFTEEYMY